MLFLDIKFYGDLQKNLCCDEVSKNNSYVTLCAENSRKKVDEKYLLIFAKLGKLGNSII